MRILYKFKASETKSITSSILTLENCSIDIDNKLEHAGLILTNTRDYLLIEALEQLTPVHAFLDLYRNRIHTNNTRYFWKLNPELSANTTRLNLVRQLKSIGIFFKIRNTHSNVFLKIKSQSFETFTKKWKLNYKQLEFDYDFDESENVYTIYYTNFEHIIQEAADNYILANTKERRIIKKHILEETLDKLKVLKKEKNQ